jgi:hypothetical protein
MPNRIKGYLYALYKIMSQDVWDVLEVNHNGSCIPNKHLARKHCSELCFIVFYLVHFVGQYTECKKMHGVNNSCFIEPED